MAPGNPPCQMRNSHYPHETGFSAFRTHEPYFGSSGQSLSMEVCCCVLRSLTRANWPMEKRREIMRTRCRIMSLLQKRRWRSSEHFSVRRRSFLGLAVTRDLLSFCSLAKFSVCAPCYWLQTGRDGTWQRDLTSPPQPQSDPAAFNSSTSIQKLFPSSAKSLYLFARGDNSSPVAFPWMSLQLTA